MNFLLEYDKFSAPRDIVITLPKSVTWSDYELELEKAAAGDIMSFKVANFPKTEAGCRCYVVHDGHVRGWMRIVGLSEKTFKCTTTGKQWSGKFVDRSGKFNEISEPVPMKGFQGFRYF